MAAVEWDRDQVITQRAGIGMVPEMVPEMEQGQEKDLIIQSVGIGMVPETVPEMEQGQEKDLVIQSVGISMARGMEPAQVKDLKMEPGTGPKRAVEPGTVMVQVVKKGRAAEREGIREMKVLLRGGLPFFIASRHIS